MSLHSLVREYNDVESQQRARLVTLFKELDRAGSAVLVIGGEAGEPGTEELRSFNNHQLEEFMARRARLDITFYSTGSSG